MSDEQKRPLADTNCRGVDGVGGEEGEKMQSEERKREIAGRRGGIEGGLGQNGG